MRIRRIYGWLGGAAAAGLAALGLVRALEDDVRYRVVAALPLEAVQAAGLSYTELKGRALVEGWYVPTDQTPRPQPQQEGVVSSTIAMYANDCAGEPGKVLVYGNAARTNVVATIVQ